MRFCGNCGTRLAEAAPSQAASAPASLQDIGVMMGADLRERLHNAGIEAAGQRRNVTVLFADLSGYTGISGELDSEEVFDLVQEYIRLLINDVYKYEGIVDKLTGDGLMALFGAPIAQENNAELAIRAALDMQADVARLSAEIRQRIGRDLYMHVGLHAGVVVVGGIGSDLLMNYTAIGDTVNLARRIEEAAEAGSILVSEAVFRQARPFFDFMPLPSLHLKGISRPVSAYRVGGLKSAPGRARGLEGLNAPMVGRDAELEQLAQALAGLSERKNGHFALVIGEAGIGKSRLTAELKALANPQAVTILEGSSLAYRRSIPYWVFLDLLRGYLNLSGAAGEVETSRALGEAVFRALGTRAAAQLPYLEFFLGLKPSNPVAAERMRFLDASQLRQQVFLALRDLFSAEAQRRPLLIILEDLHWADDASLELLQFLLYAVRQAPLMIYAITRPFSESPMSKVNEWAVRHLPGRFTPLRLQHLSPDQSLSLLRSLLAASDLPEALRGEILARAAGVPFYLEEILRMLIDRGVLRPENGGWQVAAAVDVAALGVPDSLEGLLLARFDRLDEAERKILQTASVIGHRFSVRLLEALLEGEGGHAVGAALEDLSRREFILPAASQPDAEYSFRHVLMSEAIYSTLLKKERSRLHGRVGEAIERLYPGRLDEYVELLARHYSWSPQSERALHYLLLAGEKAAAGFINEQARQHFQLALDLLPQTPHTPDQVSRIHAGMGDLQTLAGDYPVAFLHYQIALETRQDAQASGPAENSQAQECSALQRKLAKTLERQGEYEKALIRLNQAQESLSAEGQPYPVEQANLLSDKAWISFRMGNFSEAEGLLNQALSQVEHTGAYDAVASIYNRLGGIAYNQGDWNRTADYLRKSIAIREAIGDVVGLATSFNNLGLLGIEVGNFEDALESLTRSYELKSRLGQTEGISMCLSNLGWLRTQRGELQEAQACLSQALELARQIGYSSLEGEILRTTGEMHLAAQEWAQAAEVLSQAARLLAQMGANDQLVDTYRLLGEASLGADRLAEAQDYAAKAQALTSNLSSSTQELSTVQRGESWRFRGMLAGHLGDWDTALRYLKESEKIFQALGSRLYQGRAAYQLGALAEAQGDHRAAQLRYREAALLFRSVGARLDEQRAEAAALSLAQPDITYP
jgi:predicted ATPase/class 3 adenylate cyclase